MNAEAHTQAQHQQVQRLLPWYANDSLPEAEYRLVDKHIRTCLTCRRELQGLKKLAQAISQSTDLDIAAETSFANVSAKLRSHDRSADSAAPNDRQVPSRTPRRLNAYSNHRGFRYALAASILLALMPLGWRLMPIGTDGYRTLATAKPAGLAAPTLRVVFANTVSATDISAVLRDLHGEQQGEANSVGALTVRLSTEDGHPNLEQAIALLRSRSDVLLAEPVIQP